MFVMSKKNIYQLLLSLIFSSSTFAAEFRVTSIDGGCLGTTINLNGEIKRGDGATFANLFAQLKSKYLEIGCKKKLGLSDLNFYADVQLSSKGGDVNEAMKIGNVIRENESTTTVLPENECLSSCVFILGSGVLRYPYGKVGIHKPYFAELKENITTTEIKKLRDENIKAIKDYLNFMDVSERIVDDMLSIEPSKIKILSDADLEKYRLSVPDSNYEEKVTSKDARQYNLSSAEYRKKKVIADSKCGTIASRALTDMRDIFKCQTMIYLGISASEYDSRRARAFKNCGDEKEPKKRTDCFYRTTVLNQ